MNLVWIWHIDVGLVWFGFFVLFLAHSSFFFWLNWHPISFNSEIPHKNKNSYFFFWNSEQLTTLALHFQGASDSCHWEGATSFRPSPCPSLPLSPPLPVSVNQPVHIKYPALTGVWVCDFRFKTHSVTPLKTCPKPENGRIVPCWPTIGLGNPRLSAERDGLD